MKKEMEVYKLKSRFLSYEEEEKEVKKFRSMIESKYPDIDLKKYRKVSNELKEEYMSCSKEKNLDKMYQIYLGFALNRLIYDYCHYDINFLDFEDAISSASLKIWEIVKSKQTQKNVYLSEVEFFATKNVDTYLELQYVSNIRHNIEYSSKDKNVRFKDLESNENIDSLEMTNISSKDIKEMSDSEYRDLIFNIIRVLPVTYQDHLLYRYGFVDGMPHTLKETGARYHKTNEAARQIEEKAFNRLKEFDLLKYFNLGEVSKNKNITKE